jgi:hypothetical protein
MKKIFFFLSILFSSFCFSQEKSIDKSSLDFYQDSIRVICKKLYSKSPALTDEEKQKQNERLLETLDRALNIDHSFDYTFDSLSDIKILVSPDKTFKIFNWSIEIADKTQEYYGFIQRKHTQIIKKGLFKKEKTETIQIYPLIDKSSEIKKPETYVSDNKKWFGMWYYKIIEKKTKNKIYYTLLGWDGNDKFSSKRIIDVLTFDSKGSPIFGADVFSMQKKYPKRVIFEYAASCSMSLKYNDRKDSIVFDHLAPTNPLLEGQYQYYCTDMSFDGFGFKNGRWNYGMDLRATNDKSEKDKLYHDPHDISQTHNQSTDYKNILNTTAPTGDGNKVIKKERKKRKKKE